MLIVHDDVMTIQTTSHVILANLDMTALIVGLGHPVHVIEIATLIDQTNEIIDRIREIEVDTLTIAE